MNKGLNLLVIFIPSCLLQDWKSLRNFLSLGCLFCFRFLVVLVFRGVYWIVITGLYLRESNWILHPSFVFAVNKVFGQVECRWSWSRNKPESRLYCVRARCEFVSFRVLLRWYTAIIPVTRITCTCLWVSLCVSSVSSACIAAVVWTVQALKLQCCSFSLCRHISFINFSSFSIQDIFLCFPDLSSCKAWNPHMLSICIH